jgi:ABC-type transport system involved in cytochrome c biogenesis permease component
MTMSRIAHWLLVALKLVVALVLFGVAVNSDVSQATRIVAAVFLVGAILEAGLRALDTRIERAMTMATERHEHLIKHIDAVLSNQRQAIDQAAEQRWRAREPANHA